MRIGKGDREGVPRGGLSKLRLDGSLYRNLPLCKLIKRLNSKENVEQHRYPARVDNASQKTWVIKISGDNFLQVNGQGTQWPPNNTTYYRCSWLPKMVRTC